MTPEASKRLEEFFRILRGAPRSILLLDYDGTMAPFRVDRYRARPYAGVRDLLVQIQRQGRTRMAVVTGRPAGDIPRLLELESPVDVWGLHGAERVHADGRRELDQGSAAAQRELNRLRSQLRHDSFGGLFEDKANGVVMHWRGLAPEKAQMVEQKTRRLFAPMDRIDGLRLLDFEAGVELRVGRDKGGAAEAILDEAGRDLPVAFLGDDLTDESAFLSVNALGAHGLSVLMRRHWRKTDAQIWLRPPDELRAFLSMWVRSVHAQRP